MQDEPTLLNCEQVLVISVPAETRRRQFQQNQLDGLKIKHTILPAVTPNQLTREELEARRKQWGRPLKDAEVACLLSHRKAWAVVAQGTRPVLILEDDALLSAGAKDLLAVLFTAQCADIINLHCHPLPKQLALKCIETRVPGFTICETFKERSSAAAYIIWPDAANRVLAFTERLSPLADAALALTPKVRRFQLEPAAATQAAWNPEYAEMIGESTVSTLHRPKFKSWRDVLRGKAIRFYCTWLQLRSLLKGFGKSKKRIVAFCR